MPLVTQRHHPFDGVFLQPAMSPIPNNIAINFSTFFIHDSFCLCELRYSFPSPSNLASSSEPEPLPIDKISFIIKNSFHLLLHY